MTAVVFGLAGLFVAIGFWIDNDVKQRRIDAAHKADFKTLMDFHLARYTAAEARLDVLLAPYRAKWAAEE